MWFLDSEDDQVAGIGRTAGRLVQQETFVLENPDDHIPTEGLICVPINTLCVKGFDPIFVIEDLPRERVVLTDVESPFEVFMADQMGIHVALSPELLARLP